MTELTRPRPFLRQEPPTLDGGDRAYVLEELRRLEATIRDLVDLVPQETNAAPPKLRPSMIRYAKDPWWPVTGQTADAWVWFDGTDWQYL